MEFDKWNLDFENKIARIKLMKKLHRMQGDEICIRLARIYFAIEDEDVKTECRKAVYSAKKMGNKLEWYKTQNKEST